MSFETVNDVDQMLRSPNVSVRDLHAVWDQRLPVADSELQKKSATLLATEKQVAWLQDVAIGRQFMRHALAQEEYLLALDAAKEILRLPATGARDTAERLRVRMDCAAALTRLGSTFRAHEELQFALGTISSQGVNLRVDFLLQLGDIAREASYHASTRAERHDAASRALGFYQSALDEDPKRLVAMLRIAATLLTLGESGGRSHARSQDVARDILPLAGKVENESGPDLDTVEARATANAILGNDDMAMRSFEALRDLEGITTSQLAEARFRARHLAEALGKPRDFYKVAFPPLQLIVFSGHLPDLPDAGDRPRREPRLPQDAVGVVREALRESLGSLKARVGLVSASAGADLLFIEALRERQGTVHVVLPWEQEEFRRTSVQRFDPPDGPGYWERLFDKALLEAATVRTIGQAYEPGRDDVGWEYLMEVTAGIALQTARASRLDIQPMVLWNERPAYGHGGTDAFFGFWSTRLKQQPINVMPPYMRQRREESARVVTGRAERPILRQEVKSMLFADIVGYSKLSEKVIPEFIGSFLDQLSKLVATSRHAPCYVNTWGDAIYAVFDYARDAGLFALELAQMLATGESDWLGKGLYWEEQIPGDKLRRHALNIRVGLHTGPVFVHYDPVLRRIGFTGSHVSRAARIEPVTRPGEVFASEEFAALAKLGSELGRRTATAGAASDEGFDCEYAGSMPLAKGYPGRFRIYRVLPVRAFGIEDLAKAAHERYVEEALAGGKKPAPDNPLHRWEELAEDFRDASRALVADIPNKLRLLGYELTPGHGIAPSSLSITEDQIEQQAMREHNRWMNERVRSGWTYAPVRDNARKHHPCIVPWEELPEEEKEKDRTAVLMVPELIERAGFKMRRR